MSHSPWCSAVYCRRDKDGGCRICEDKPTLSIRCHFVAQKLFEGHHIVWNDQLGAAEEIEKFVREEIAKAMRQ